VSQNCNRVSGQKQIKNVRIAFVTVPAANLAALEGASTRMAERTPSVEGNLIFQLDPTVDCAAPSTMVVYTKYESTL
jgi:hypothetical protein